MSDRVDTTEDANQPANVDAVGDVLRRQAKLSELPAGHHTVLVGRQRTDSPIRAA
jgi:hypothetical protein